MEHVIQDRLMFIDLLIFTCLLQPSLGFALVEFVWKLYEAVDIL